MGITWEDEEASLEVRVSKGGKQEEGEEWGESVDARSG